MFLRDEGNDSSKPAQSGFEILIVLDQQVLGLIVIQNNFWFTKFNQETI